MVSYCKLTGTLNNVGIKDNYAHGLQTYTHFMVDFMCVSEKS